MEIVVYNVKGSQTERKIKLDDAIFSIEPNDHAIYLDVKQHMANKRQGTHSSLEKSTISGSTRKLKKQKGTGGARAGRSRVRCSEAVPGYSVRTPEITTSS